MPEPFDPYKWMLNPPPTPNLSYRQISDQYDRDKKRFSWAKDLNLEDYSKVMNERTQSNMFEQGLDQSWIKDLSVGIDHTIENTGLDKIGGSIGGALGGLVGYEQAGREAGAGLPRMAANMVPGIAGTIGAGLLAPETGGASLLTVPSLLGMVGTGFLTGAQTYTETDSPGAALLSGGIAAATPGVGKLGTEFVGQSLAKSAGTMVGETLGQRLAAYGGGQTAMGLFNEAGYQVPRLLRGEGLDLSGEHLTQQAIGQLAFLPMDVAGLFKGPSNEQKASFYTQKREAEIAQREAAARTGAGEIITSTEFPAPTTPSAAKVSTPETIFTPEELLRSGDVQPDYLSWRGRQVIDTGETRITPSSNKRQVLVRDGQSKFWVDEAEVQPWNPAAETRFTLVGDGQLESTGTKQGRLLPSVEETQQLVRGPLALRPTMALALTSPRLVTPQVQEKVRSQVADVIKEKDATKALKKIHSLYNELEPLYKVHDVALEKLDDADLRSRLTSLVEQGHDLNDAVIKTITSLKSVLDQAVETKRREYGATNRLVTNSEVEAIRARLAAARQKSQMSITGIDPSLVPDYFKLALYHLEALSRAGAVKFQDWIDTMKGDPIGETLNDVQLRTLFQHARDYKFGGEPERVNPEQQARVEQATAKLTAMDDEWQRARSQVPTPEQEAWVSANKNPVLRLNRLREKVLKKYKYLNQYPRVQEDMLVAMANARLEEPDHTIMGFLKTAAENAHKQELRRTSTEETVLHENIQQEGKAYELAAEINRGIPADGTETAVVVGSGRKGEKGPFKVVLRQKSQRSLDDRFGYDVETAKRDAEDDLIRQADESEPVRPEDDDSLLDVDEDGELVAKTLQDLDSELDKVSADLSREAKETLHATVDGFWDKLIAKVTGDTFMYRGVKEPYKFAARAQVMLEYFRDRRMNIDEKDSSYLMQRMAEIGAPFESSEKLRAWYGKKGQFYENFFGDRGWLASQPEVLELVQKRKGNQPQQRPESTQQYVLPIGPIEQLPPGDVGAVGFGPNATTRSSREYPAQYGRETTPLASTMSAQDFGFQYALRSGYSIAGAKLFGDRLARVAAVWRAADRARVTGLINSPDLGVALTSVSDPAWRGLIAVAQRTFAQHELDLWHKGIALGHEGWHIVEQAYDRGELAPNEKRAVEQMKEIASALDQDQRREMLKSMIFQSLPEGTAANLNREAAGEMISFLNYAVQTPREFMATVAGLHALALSEPTKSKSAINRVKEALIYGDGAVAKFVQLVFRTASQFTDALKAMWRGVELGLVEDGKRLGPDAVLDRMANAFKTLARTPEEITTALKTLDTLQRTSPETWAEMLAINRAPTFDDTKFSEPVLDSSLKEYRARILPPDDPNNISKVDSYWWNLSQLVEAHPKLRPVLTEALSYQALAEDASEAVMSPLFQRDASSGKTKIVGPVKEIKEVVGNERMSKAFSELTLNEQELGRFLTDPEKQAIRTKHGLSDPQLRTIEAAREGIKNVNQMVGQQLKRFGRMQIEHLVAKTILRNEPANYTTALKQATTITDAAVAPLTGGIPIMLDPVALGIKPETLTKAYGAAQSVAPKWAAVAKTIDGMPWFVTEQRYGQYHVSYKKAGETLRGRQSAKSMGEFRDLVARLRADPTVSDLKTFETNAGELAGINSDIVSRFKELEEASYQTALSTLDPAEATKMRDAYSFGQSIDKELAARGLGKYSIHRRFAPGREDLNMVQNALDYMSTMPWALSKNWLKERANVTLLDADIQANPSVQTIGRQKFDSMLATTSKLENAVRAGSFYYFLGGNLSSLLVELAQPLQMLPAQFTADGIKVSDGYKLISKAAGMVAKAFGTDTHGDPFIDNMMHRLETGRYVDRGIMTQFFDETELNHMNLRRFASGKRDPLDYAAAATKPIAWLGSMWRNLYGRATSFTTRISAVAALLHAQEQVKAGKMSNEDAFNYAVRIVGLTAPGTGGRATQPVGLGSDGKFLTRSAKGMVTALQSYNLAMTSGFLRMARDAVKSGSMTTAQSKAFAQLVGTQMLFAGALGMPGIGIAVGLANQFFPQFEVKRKLRENIAKLGGDDAELGGLIADIALRGLVTGAGPVDMSSRFGLSSLLGVSSYDGFKAQNLLGAPGGIADNLWKGWQSAQQGRYGEALQQSAPTSLRNLLQAYRNEGQVLDKDGNLLYDPSTGEQVAMAVGFTPKRVSDIREYNRLATQADEVAKNEQDRFLDNVANLIVENRYDEARGLLVDREKRNPTEFSAYDGLKAATERAVNKTIPKDPRREGAKSGSLERQALLSTYGALNQAPSELNRLETKASILGQFGIQTDPHDILEATMVDQVMSQHPTMMRSQAQALVREMLGRRAHSL